MDNKNVTLCTHRRNYCASLYVLHHLNIYIIEWFEYVYETYNLIVQQPIIENNQIFNKTNIYI